jgi:hypothetical protein
LGPNNIFQQLFSWNIESDYSCGGKPDEHLMGKGRQSHQALVFVAKLDCQCDIDLVKQMHLCGYLEKKQQNIFF